MTKPYIIIGTSAAGLSAANTLRRLDPTIPILCISDEAEMPYNKCWLADHVAGIKTREQVYTLSLHAAGEKNIQFLLATRVVRIIPEQSVIMLHNGSLLTYTKLFIGTGSRPFIPPLPGLQEYDGVTTFHSLRDIATLLTAVAQRKARNVVIIGSGLSGLECADSLRAHGVVSCIIEKNSRLLASLLPVQGSRLLAQTMDQYGVASYCNQQVTALLGTGRTLQGVTLRDGTQRAADIVVIATGVRSNGEIVRQGGLAMIGDSIQVDEYMQTSDPAIYAGGDVCAVNDLLTGQLVASRSWPDASLQGLTAAYNMLGQPKKYAGVALVASSSFFGQTFFSCGPIIQAVEQGNALEVSKTDEYRVYLLKNGLLRGFALLGCHVQGSRLKRLVLSGQPVSEFDLS